MMCLDRLPPFRKISFTFLSCPLCFAKHQNDPINPLDSGGYFDIHMCDLGIIFPFGLCL